MLRICLLALVAALTLAASPLQAADADERFAALVDRLKAGATDVDYTALRQAYAESSGYDPYSAQVTAPHRAMFEQMNGGDCAAALGSADSVLAVNYIHASAHLVKWLCSVKEGKAEAAPFHRAVLVGLLKSVTGGKDGRTPGSAYSVVAIDEEYALLRFFLLQMTRQRLVQDGGSMFDMLEFVAQDGKRGAFFFNVDRPQNWAKAQLSLPAR